jgi:hypothetical protein
MRQDGEDGFTPRTLDAPDGHPTQPDTDIMGVARQAPALATGRLVFQLKTQGQDEGENKFQKRFAIAKQLKVGGFILNIDGNGAVFSCAFGCVSHGSPPGYEVSRAHDTPWGECLERARVL